MHPTTGPAALDAPRPPWRLAVPVLPWLLAAGLGAAALLGAPATADVGPPATPAASAAPVPDPTPTPARTAVPRDATTTEAPALAPTTLLAVTAAARAVLGDAGLSAGPAAGRWVLDTAIGRVLPVDAEHAVAVVHATVIERAGEGWTGPRPAAAVVGLTTRRGTTAVGPAWPLAAPTVAEAADAEASAAADGAPVTDLELLTILDALTDGGWLLDALEGATRRSPSLVEATVIGTAPSGTAAAEHRVWLRVDDAGAHLLDLSPMTRSPSGAPDTEDPR